MRGSLLRDIQSLYIQSWSCVKILCSKSDSFQVRVWPCDDFHGRILRCSLGGEGMQFGELGISSLLFADDVVLMGSSVHDLQHSLDRFAIEYEVTGMTPGGELVLTPSEGESSTTSFNYFFAIEWTMEDLL